MTATTAGVRGRDDDGQGINEALAAVGDTGPLTDEERPAAPSSVLASLRERRAAARKALFIDVNVPGLEGAFVRFRALTPRERTTINAAHEKARAGEKDLRVNAAMLATTCLGVYDTGADGKPISIDEGDPHGTPPRFDQRLAGLIGMAWLEETRASDVVREFYLEPMHVLSVGDEVALWSLARDTELRRAEQGD